MARKNLNDVIYGDRAKVRASNIFDFDKGGFTKSSGSGGYSGKRCYHTHPPLTLPGTDLVIHGGSCLSPAVADADIYVGFDSGMKLTSRQFPWTDGYELLFRITDMDAPRDPAQFKALVRWTKEQLEAGKKVHCGCIGGHGRTGTFLAALCSEFGETDAIAYVRKNYCQKAVESSTQIKFLQQHFKVKAATGYKSGGWSKKAGSAKDDNLERFSPVSGNGCIWDPVL